MRGEDEHSFAAFDDEDVIGQHSMSESAFDPFDTSEFDEDGIGEDSFGADFGENPFAETPKSPVKNPERRRRRDSVKSRLDESASRRMNGSLRGGTRVRVNGASSSRLGNSLSVLDESSPHLESDLHDSRALMDESSRRRRHTKPPSGAVFPKNASRRASSERPRPTTRRPTARSSTDPTTARDRRAAMSRSSGSRRSMDESRGSRRSLLSNSSHHHDDDAPLSPGGSRRRSSTRVDGRPSPRSKRDSVASVAKSVSIVSQSKRDPKAAADARSRIRKEAALKKERELQEEKAARAAKLALQREKLEKQKQKTNELLGRKLAKLDAKNGEKGETKATDEVSVGSRGLGASVHSNTREQRRRRRTHLSHNILVRNMNQMTSSTVAEEGEYEEGDEGTVHEDDLSVSASVMDSSKKEAWQRRRERQHLM